MRVSEVIQSTKKVITVTPIPVHSMAELLTNLAYLQEQGVPVDSHIDTGRLSSLRYTSRQDVDVFMYFDPDESDPAW